ncbi:MAG TPA: caspase family protein [Polyangiaceae bacterium]|nr:caspase family protein [Polyangiaceae bacterium]
MKWLLVTVQTRSPNLSTLAQKSCGLFRASEATRESKGFFSRSALVYDESMYQVIACGVNQGPSGHSLRFAEKDARDVATFFRSSLGPPASEEQVVLLEGSAATRRRIELHILSAGLIQSAEYLVFYFSGHGNTDGVLAADGVLLYDDIIQALQSAKVRFTTVVLDVCSAASYLGFLKEASVGGFGAPSSLELQWLQALAAATPGNRLIFSTGATKVSRESSKHSNGLFTSAFLTALKRCRGDIDMEGASWISDQRAFFATKALLGQMTGGRQIPVERGLTGDFPLAISQANEPVGEAVFLRTSIESGTLNVHFEIEGRKHMDTRVRWRLLNALGDEIAHGLDAVQPVEESVVFKGRIKCPHSTVTGDPVSRLLRARHGAAPIEWILVIEDEHERAFDEKVVSAKLSW